MPITDIRAHADHNQEKILLIEDDPGNITFLKLLIETIGYECIVAETGAKALHQLKTKHFNLIFMDLHLPDTDGQSLCKRVVNELPDMDTPIVGLSADVDSNIHKTCVKAGMKSLYSKSLALDDLQDIIDNHITKAAA